MFYYLLEIWKFTLYYIHKFTTWRKVTVNEEQIEARARLLQKIDEKNGNIRKLAKNVDERGRVSEAMRRQKFLEETRACGVLIFHLSVMDSDYDEIMDSLKNGVSADAADEDGLTALHYAVLFNDERMVSLLLRNGAEVNAQDDEGVTALHLAAKYGRTRFIQFLLEKGANAKLQTDAGETALEMLVPYEKRWAMKLLFRNAADQEDEPILRSSEDFRRSINSRLNKSEGYFYR